MKYERLTPMVRTKEFKKTISFYTEVLGFTCDSMSEESGWASFILGNAKIMVAAPNDHEPFDRAVFTGSFYIHTDDVEAAWEMLKDKARVCYPIETFEYGMREFAVYDNNGYLFQFGQEAGVGKD